MNRIYKTVFNRNLGIWQAASELAKAGGRKEAKVCMGAAICAAGLAMVPATGRADTVIDNGTTVTIPGDYASPWDAGGFLTIGLNGAGTLLVEDGGIVSSVGGAVGNGGTGTVTVTGSGSSWSSSSSIFVGYDSTGTLTITDGAVVRTSQFVAMGSAPAGAGTLNLNGTSGSRGVLEASLVMKGSGTAAFNFDGGVLRATQNSADFLKSFGTNSVNIQSGGAWLDTQAFNVVIVNPNVLTGSGGLTKLGSGTLSIAGSNSYAGNTTVSAGTLQFDSYTQNASQTLGIGASSLTNFGKLNVTGTASFAANAKIDVNVAGANTLASGETLTNVVTAGTLNATTFAVSDNSALFDFQTVINGNAVDLAIVQASTSGTGVSDAVRAWGIDSAEGAARVLDNAIAAAPGGDMDTVITALGSLGSQQEVGRAAAQTLPLLSGGVAQSTLHMLSSFNRTLQDRLGNAGRGTSGASAGGSSGSSGETDWSDRKAWVRPFGSYADQDDRDGAAGFSARTWGISFGAEGNADRDKRIGMAYAYANSSINGNTGLSSASQNADMDSHLLALYGSRSLPSDLQLGWQADLGYNAVKGKRQISFGGLNRTARSDYTSYSAHAGASLSKSLVLNASTIFSPGVRVDYTWLRDPSYRESGADALNLHVDGNTTQSLVLTAEGRVRHALSTRSWLNANAGVGYDAINDRSDVVSTYAGAPGQSFSTRGIDPSPWRLIGGIGYTLQANAGMQVLIRYDLEGATGYVNQSASLKANWLF